MLCPHVLFLIPRSTVLLPSLQGVCYVVTWWEERQCAQYDTLGDLPGVTQAAQPRPIL